MFRTVVVPLDGSGFAEFALPLAVSIARRAGAALRLVRVTPTPGDVMFWAPSPGSPLATQIQDQFRAEAMAYLEGIARRLADAAAGAVTCAVLDGEVSEAVRDDVDKHGADLLVMTSHGRGMLGRIWLGSVADELIRSLTIPVLLVRPPAGHPESQPGPDLGHEATIRHIVMALDGTPLAERVLSPVLAVGRLMNSDYTLVRVIGVPAYAQLTPALFGEINDLKEQVYREADGYLQRVAERLRADGSRVQTRVLFAERPAAGILEVAAGADLIALETHGRHHLSRLLMGSVADRVVRGSSLPVLVCRAGETAG
jgi:nucleotide-binding universal stress UspA family protein